MYTVVNKSVFLWIRTTSRIVCNRRYFRESEVFNYLNGMPKRKQDKRFQDKKISVLVDKKVYSAYIEVVGSGAIGMPTSVLLGTNNTTYLINCGEGTSKLASEYRFKFHRTPTIFITYPSWQNIAGLVGLSLAAQEAHSTECTIYGHRHIGHIFSSLSRNIKLKNLKITIKDCNPSEEFMCRSDALFIKSVLLTSSQSVNLDKQVVSSKDLLENEKEESHSEGSPSKPKKFKSSETNTSAGGKEANCDTEDIMKNAVSYIFNCKETPGKLNIEKCVDLGITPGPLLGLLKSGEDVTLENGVTIRSADVTEPSIPGVTVIAVECPSEDFLDSLLAEPAFMQYQTTEDPADAVIHFSKSHVIKHEKYQEWLSRFSKNTLHLFINEENNRSGSVAIHRQQYKLHSLQPEVFPLLDDPKIPSYPREGDTHIPEGHVLVPFEETNLHTTDTKQIYKDRIYIKCESNPYIFGETLCDVHLKPRNPKFDYSLSLVLKRDQFLQEMFEDKEAKEKFEEYVRNLRDQEKTLDRSKEYPKIVFLGTGSSRPSKVRNGSGILIFINEFDCIMFDCAESTFSQLISLYGIKKTRKILRNLHAIFVSHMHIDHHWGLITLLKERKIAFDEERESGKEQFKKVFLLAPMPMNKWLNLFSEKFEEISDLYKTIPNSFLEVHENSEYESEDICHCKNIYNFSSINTVPVHHCYASYGISISHKNGWKITYSGDTRPCKDLAVLGRNSDILIHEATFENVYSEDAKAKLHSTTEEAINIGKTMNAKFILLTHFSQRYSYLPNTECFLKHQNVGIAFDFMEVPYYSLPLLPELIRPLQIVLSKHDEHNKMSTEIFLLKKERLKSEELNFSTPDIAAKIF